jgi:hypothetical protein
MTVIVFDFGNCGTNEPGITRDRDLGLSSEGLSRAEEIEHGGQCQPD